jgi:hypothetical protein
MLSKFPIVLVTLGQVPGYFILSEGSVVEEHEHASLGCKYLRYLANYILIDDGKIFADVA